MAFDVEVEQQMGKTCSREWKGINFGQVAFYLVFAGFFGKEVRRISVSKGKISSSLLAPPLPSNYVHRVMLQ